MRVVLAAGLLAPAVLGATALLWTAVQGGPGDKDRLRAELQRDGSVRLADGRSLTVDALIEDSRRGTKYLVSYTRGMDENWSELDGLVARMNKADIVVVGLLNEDIS